MIQHSSSRATSARSRSIRTHLHHYGSGPSAMASARRRRESCYTFLHWTLLGLLVRMAPRDQRVQVLARHLVGRQVCQPARGVRHEGALLFHSTVVPRARPRVSRPVGLVHRAHDLVLEYHLRRALRRRPLRALVVQLLRLDLEHFERRVACVEPTRRRRGATEI